MKYIKSEALSNLGSFPVAIVVSEFNQEITQALLKGALDRLNHYDFDANDITVVEVPGAIEIPLIAQKLADKNQYAAIIALGAVVRGETSHYDYVCQQVSNGCQQVMLDCEIPIVFGILTTENDEQAWDRLGGKHGHKGMEAVDCALSMVSVLQQLDQD